jgi:hypothetical protein
MQLRLHWQALDDRDAELAELRALRFGGYGSQGSMESED